MNTNRNGSIMIIEKFNTYDDIYVKFIKDGNMVHTQYTHFKKGGVRNPYDISLFGVGYIGEGKYKSNEIKGSKKNTIQYETWSGMIKRCYSEKRLERFPTYRDVTVCEEWHNFQNFAKWFDDNYYEVEGHRMLLDKDILVKGNKLYSPDTCVFVPSFFNNLFIKSNSARGSLPIGVSFHKQAKTYRAYCNNGKRKKISLGSFSNPEDAFSVYKTYKEDLIKTIANEYKDRIPHKLYLAMMNYQVEIND